MPCMCGDSECPSCGSMQETLSEPDEVIAYRQDMPEHGAARGVHGPYVWLAECPTCASTIRVGSEKEGLEQLHQHSEGCNGFRVVKGHRCDCCNATTTTVELCDCCGRLCCEDCAHVRERESDPCFCPQQACRYRMADEAKPCD